VEEERAKRCGLREELDTDREKGIVLGIVRQFADRPGAEVGR